MWSQGRFCLFLYLLYLLTRDIENANNPKEEGDIKDIGERKDNIGPKSLWDWEGMKSKMQVERVPLREAGAFLRNSKRKYKDGCMYRQAWRDGIEKL